MARSKGKQKGSAFERKVCKLLSLWVSHGESEDLFWRSAMSGGRATVGARKGKHHVRHAGDITATSPEGHALTDLWYVECKAYRNLRIGSAFLKSAGPLIGFWDTAVLEAGRYGKLPMLIAKQNQTPVFVLIPMATGPAFHHARVATFHEMGCDVLDLKRMLSVPFKLPAVKFKLSGHRVRERL